MSANYAPDRLSAAKDIRDAGKAVILSIPTSAAFDPVADTSTPGTPGDFATHALEEAQNNLSLWDSTTLQESLVEGGDRFFMVAALCDDGTVLPEPHVGHFLFVGSVLGTQLAIKGVRALRPGDVDIYYEIQARG